jgi:N-acetylglucosaminyl-diphospho-decaprenol L-rhamnosyltransferase
MRDATMFPPHRRTSVRSSISGHRWIPALDGLTNIGDTPVEPRPDRRRSSHDVGVRRTNTTARAVEQTDAHPTAPRLLVAVVTFNSESLLPDLLTSLESGLAGLDWQLVVADNDSSDGTVEWLERHAGDAVLVRMGRNAGYAAGINAAVRRAGPHSAVLVLNPDVRLDPGCGLELMATLHAGGPRVGLAVPRLRDAAGALILSMRREPTLLRALGDAILGTRIAGRWSATGEMVTRPSAYDVGTTTDWAEGSTQLVSAECWARCGPWNESYFLYSEEVDFALRARDAGFATRFVPEAGAVHLEGGSGSSPELWALLVTNRVRLFRSRHSRRLSVLFWAVVLFREGSRACLGREHSRTAVGWLLSPRRMRETPGPWSLRPDRSAPVNAIASPGPSLW